MKECTASVVGKSFTSGPAEVAKFIQQKSDHMGNVIREGNIQSE